MTFGQYTSINNSNYKVPFCAVSPDAPGIIAKPIQKVDTVINDTVDKFVKQPEDEETRKSNKTAIAVGSTVLVLSGLVALLNPKFSGRLVNKLKTMSSKAGANVNQSKNNVLKSKFYKASEKVWGNIADFLQFTNTVNACKDIGFKKLCTEVKGVKTVMTKPHQTLTRWFDNISKHTVQGKYAKANKKMANLENLINHYKGKLSPAEQKQLDAKLAELKSAQNYFSKAEVANRLNEQEKVMTNLEKDFTEKLKSYLKDMKSGSTNRKKLFKDNMSFWAEDILMPSRNKLEADGIKFVDKVAGDGKTQKGTLNEIVEIMSPHLNQEEKTLLEKSVGKTVKKLRKANHSETVEYFDKKRDLVLGGTPTDMATALFGIGTCGLAINAADTKEDRISRALTVGFPIIAGIGSSIAFTAMLFSGVQSMIYGWIASIGLSKLGSVLDKHLVPKPQKEVINA